MIRALRLLFLGLLAVVLIGLALANRQIVTLRVLPLEAGSFLGWDWAVQVPLFLVILAGVLLGLLIGFVWEWVVVSGDPQNFAGAFDGGLQLVLADSGTVRAAQRRICEFGQIECGGFGTGARGKTRIGRPRSRLLVSH